MTIITLSVEQIVKINFAVISKHRGNFIAPTNMINANQLDWAVNTINNPYVFGEDRYPGIHNKISLLGWQISTTHIFNDGNKRTSLAAMLVMLRFNGYDLEFSNDEDANSKLTKLGFDIADHSNKNISREFLTNWLIQNTKQI